MAREVLMSFDVWRIQQVSLLIMVLSVLWIRIDPRHVGRIPTWQMAAVIIPFMSAATVLLMSIFVVIWTNMVIG